MKYWVYMNGEVPGSYAPGELAALPGFSMTTLICPAEGEILEKNWRRAGEFDEIIKVLHERDSKLPPSAPRQAQESVMTGDVNALLDKASTRLFSHVSDLMKELENRREERALTHTLQRQLIDLKDQLRQAKEHGDDLESKMTRIIDLEEAARRDQAQIQKLEAVLKTRDEGMNEQRIQLEKLRIEVENSKRRLGETVNDLSIRNRLVDKLSRDLTEKELSLAKALGVIRRLEEDLNRIVPAQGAAVHPAIDAVVPPPPPTEAKEEKEEPAPVAAEEAEAEKEEKKPLPKIDVPVQSPRGQPQAQDALVKRFKKLINKYEH